MRRIVNFIFPFAILFGSLFLDVFLIQANNFNAIIIPIEILLFLIVLYFNFQIIDFKEDYISFFRIFRAKRRIRYSIIKELKVTHFINERKSGTRSGYKFEIILKNDEYFIKLCYDEIYKNQLVQFFKDKNVYVNFVESPLNTYEER